MELLIIIGLGILVVAALGGRSAEPQTPQVIYVPVEAPRRPSGCLPAIVIGAILLLLAAQVMQR